MNNALYFPRRKRDVHKYIEITDRFMLELDYSDNTEQIYSNPDMMMTLSKRYSMFYFFKRDTDALASQIRQILGVGGVLKNK